MDAHYGAVFSEFDWKPAKKLALRFGLRAEFDELVEDYNLAPRLSLAWKTGNDAQLAFAWGDFYQSPQTEFYWAGTPLLTFERATHYILNYQWLTDNYSLRIEAYHKDYKDLVSNAGENTFDNSGFGYARGIELFWRDRKSISRLDYWVTYSYLDTERKFRDFPVSTQPDFASDHTLNIIGQYQLIPQRLDFGLGYAFASGRPYDDPLESGFLVSRTPAYHNISWNASYITSIFDQFTVIYASVNNPFAFEQVFGYRYSEDGMAREPIGPTAQRSFFVGMFVLIGI